MDKETKSLVKNLLGVGTEQICHLYNGMCPDTVERKGVSDRTCPACQILIQANKFIRRVGA